MTDSDIQLPTITMASKCRWVLPVRAFNDSSSRFSVGDLDLEISQYVVVLTPRNLENVRRVLANVAE